MELQKFIDDNENYIDEFKKRGLIVKRFSKENLILVKYKFNENLEEGWMKYCKGSVIDTKNNKIVLLPPMKAEELEYPLTRDITKEENYDISYLLDGTMINIFFHNDKWLMSTRSDIGCLNKWNDHLNFKDMFFETVNDDDFYNKLDQNNTYSFILQHKLNRNVSMVYENIIYLVEVRNKNNLELLELPRLDNIINIESLKLVFQNVDEINNVFSFFDFNLKGLNISINGVRYKLISKQFDLVKNICINTTNNMKKFIYLKKEDKLNEYLFFYNEYKEIFKNYESKYNIMVNELYDNYCKVNISKEIELKDVPFQLKPLIFDIHKIYLSYKRKITKKIVDKYMISLDLNKILFVIDYYKN